jgi:hypothetical protein
MISDIAKLNNAIDQAAPDRKLAAAVQAQKTKIEGEIASRGFAEVTVGGRTFRVQPSRTPDRTAK